MEEVIAVGRVVLGDPALRLGTAEGEHVVAVFGLVVHTVKPRQLQRHRTVLTDQQILIQGNSTLKGGGGHHELMCNEFTVYSSYGNSHMGAG